MNIYFSKYFFIKKISRENAKKVTILIVSCLGVLLNAENKANIIEALSEIPDFTKPHIEEALKKVFNACESFQAFLKTFKIHLP